MTKSGSSGGFRVERGEVRLDKAVAEHFGCGRRAVRGLVLKGLVTVDGRRARSSQLLTKGQQVWVIAQAETASPGIIDASQSMRTLAQTESYVAVYKPAGLHSHAGRNPGSVAEQLCALRSEQSQVGLRAAEGGLLHRLDRDTCGVMLAARSPASYKTGRAAFSAGRVRKFYLALVEGRPEPHSLSIATPLVRLHSRVRPARAREYGLPALSEVEVLESGRHWSLVGVRIHTGVTHQIRAHLASIGHPLLGDTKYGGPSAPSGCRAGHLLHAQRIALADGPDVSCGPGAEFLKALSLLRRGG